MAPGARRLPDRAGAVATRSRLWDHRCRLSLDGRYPAPTSPPSQARFQGTFSTSSTMRATGLGQLLMPIELGILLRRPDGPGPSFTRPPISAHVVARA